MNSGPTLTSGVPITVSPSDVNGQANGSTPFTRTYNNGTVVNLTAPLSVASGGFNYSFASWTGCDSVSGTSQSICTLTMNADRPVNATYTQQSQILRTLTVNSGPTLTSGVSITVTPSDNNFQGNGTTPFTRSYLNGTVVNLTAPLTAAGNNFNFWTGCDSVSGTSQSICTLTMNADRPVNATYTTIPIAIAVSPASLSFGNQLVGTSTAPRTITATSTGSAAITISSVSFGTGDSGQFAIAADNCSGRSIAPGVNCTIDVTFTPGAARGFFVTLLIFHNATNMSSPVQVQVSGTGIPPTLTITPTSISFSGSQGGNNPPSQSLNIALNQASTTWSASSNQSWLSLSPSVGTGAGQITVSANITGLTSGTYNAAITILASVLTTAALGSPATIPVTLTITGCVFTLSGSSQAFAHTGGSGSVVVSTSSGCPWTATSNDSWMTITAGSGGNGSGTVTFSVAANSTSTLRTGTITIAGQTFTVNQDAPPSLRVTSLTLNPSPVVGGNPAVGAVILSDSAPVGGSSVSLVSSDSHAVVQSIVIVPAGSNSATFMANTTALSAGQQVSPTITASLNGSVQSVLTVTPVPVPSTPPVGFVDYVADAFTGGTNIPQGRTLILNGWAADAEDGAPVSRVEVRIDGNPVGNAVLGILRQDVANSSGRPNYAFSGWTFSLPGLSVSQGTHTVSAVAFDSSRQSATLAGTPNITVGPPVGSRPFGYVDIAWDEVDRDASVPQSGRLVVAGWAADNEDGSPVARIDVLIDGVFVDSATRGLIRNDVANALGQPRFANSGWSLTLPAGILILGTHTVTAVASDLSGNTATLSGPKTITVTPAAGNQLPIGFLDVAVDAADGDAIVSRFGTVQVAGWAADNEDGAPVARVEVRIDGIAAGNAQLGIPRPDVATALNRPNFVNSGWRLNVVPANAGLTAGTHTVTAVAFDSAGASTQLTGSRTITIF